MHKVENGSNGGVYLKNITKLPDHDLKANLTDLTMGEKDDEEMNKAGRNSKSKKNKFQLEEEEKIEIVKY